MWCNHPFSQRNKAVKRVGVLKNVLDVGLVKKLEEGRGEGGGGVDSIRGLLKIGMLGTLYDTGSKLHLIITYGYSNVYPVSKILTETRPMGNFEICVNMFLFLILHLVKVLILHKLCQLTFTH